MDQPHFTPSVVQDVDCKRGEHHEGHSKENKVGVVDFLAEVRVTVLLDPTLVVNAAEEA